MDNDDFMKELEEITKNMEKDFSQESNTQDKKIINNIKNISQSQNPMDFNMNLLNEGNEELMMKELEKLLGSFANMGDTAKMGNLGDFNNLNINAEDPETKQMMKLLGICLILIL